MFSIVPYAGPHTGHGWPVPVDGYSTEAAQASMERALVQFELADQLGFDWVTVAEHHYSPASLTPNPMVMAAAVAQRVKRAKIALLGSNVPIQNPVRVAEEFAMLDTLTGGRLIAGMLRGTSNEYATYGVNPAESRERFMEALELIVRAWTEPQPFGWLGRYYEYRHDLDLAPPGAGAPSPDLHVDLKPGGSRVRGGQADQRRARGDHAGSSAGVGARVSRSRGQPRLGAGARAAALPDRRARGRVRCARPREHGANDRRPGTRRGPGLSRANPAADEAATRAGYYGRDTPRQRSRLHAGGDIDERIETAQLMLGSPETVLGQVDRLRRELGVGIVELIFIGPAPDQTRRSLELFGTEVLPRMQEL